ncbi:MAG: ATP-dependent helicase, partial [Proteobacteria bacterium]|nr:ATP-dependent helicase [Pseudomonadota bacterium]
KRGGLKLNELAHNKDVISYLRVVANPHDHLSWNRLLLQLDKVGPKTAQNILSRVKSADDPLAALKEYPAGKTWREGLAELLEMLEALRQPGMIMGQMFERIMDYYEPIFERVYHDDYPRRRRDLDELGRVMSGYVDLQGFLDDASPDPPQAGAIQEDGGKRLVLSTIHSAKGLEWDTVFIINLAEGRFPSSQAVLPAHKEEERRLLYVAATRARKQLYLVYPQEVMSYDSSSAAGGPSPFIQELPHALTQAPVAAAWQPQTSAYCMEQEDRPDYSIPPLKSASSPGSSAQSGAVSARNIKLGNRVRHPFFGEGVVEKVVSSKSVEVLFARHGRKTLHLDYAKLELVS